MKITDEQILDTALQLGLDPWDVEWLVVPPHVMYDVAARGMPGRFSHWLWGKWYWRMKGGFDAGYSRIYELVLPTNPSLAFLMESNNPIDNLLVKAHVLGHVDFFKHNRHYRDVDQKAHENAALRAERIRKYEARYGREEVERAITIAMAIAKYSHPDGWLGWENPPDLPPEPHDPFYDLRGDLDRKVQPATKPGDDDEDTPGKQDRTLRPTQDILDFLVKTWPRLHDWERDVLAIVRQEMLVHHGSMLTKVPNEGWATYWHQQIMHNLPLSDAERAEFAVVHASVVKPHPLDINPYHLGVAIWRSIEKRFGREKMFEIRKSCGSLDFIRNWLDKETVEEEGYYTYSVEHNSLYVVQEAEDWEKVRDGIVNELAYSRPDVWLVDASPSEAPSSIRLHHNYSGRELHQEDAIRVVTDLSELLRGEVVLSSVWENKKQKIVANNGNLDRVAKLKGELKGGQWIWSRT